MLTEHSLTERMRSFFGNPVKAAEEKVIDHTTQRVERSATRVENPTTRISRADLDLLTMHQHTPFGLRLGTAATYQRVPLHKSLDAPAGGVIWRIELHGLLRDAEALGFDVLGDVVIGRSGDGTQPVDIALDRFGAGEQGVSRRHAMLRPTRNCLYLLDLDSTNGTFYNAMRLGCGVVHAIKNDDTITLGSFSFTVRIIDCPSMH